MATWSEFFDECPELAIPVRDRFAAHRHALLATLRADGSPRISGTETQFVLGHLWMGSMRDAVKARDLQRDGRFALHSAPDAAELSHGDAKISGVAVEIADESTIATWATELAQPPPGSLHLFRCDVLDVSLVQLKGDHLLITWWRYGVGVRRTERY
jgi:hypothetical protein